MSTDANQKPRRPRSFTIVAIGEARLDIQKILQETHKTDSDRALGIVWGSVVEMCLTRALKESFHYQKTIFESRFHNSAPFGSFAIKIDLGLLTGLYGETAWRDLVTLKNIRNKFTHDSDASSFDSQSVSALCSNFKLIERYAADLDEELAKEKELGKKHEPQGHLPISEWKHWVFTHDLKGELSYPCGRFMLAVQVLTWALCAKPNLRREPNF